MPWQKTPHIPFGLRSSPGGFSLIEILIVLVLMGLSSSLIIPSFGDSLVIMEGRSSVKKVAALLRYGRSQAVTQQQTHAVVFDSQKKKITFSAVDKPNNDIVFPDDSNRQSSGNKDNRTYTLPERMWIDFPNSITDELVDETFSVLFYPSGGSSGGGVILRDGRGKKYTLAVNIITGAVHVAE